MYRLPLLLITAFSLAALAEQPHSHQASEMELPTDAVATLQPKSGTSVHGMIKLHQGDGYVQISGKVMGLTPGKHGFHIHEFGDISDPEAKNAGGHYNPTGKPHGAPGEHERHAGDLGNIEAGEDGTATVNMKAKGIHLHLVVGRSIVVHADADDLTSQPSGNAGPRVAAGVIGLTKSTKMSKGKADTLSN